MDWIKRNKKALLLLLGGAVLMAVLVTVILVRREDRGFMIRECVKGQSNGFTKWGFSDLPVPIFLDQLALEHGGVTTTSAQRWNEAAGKTLLGDPQVASPHDRAKCKETGKPGDPVILITRLNSDGETSEMDKAVGAEDVPGHAHLYWDSACRIRCVEIGFPGLADKSKWEKIMMHELGHALGLDHDDYEESVMYYGGRAMGWGMDAVTEEDKTTLRGAYK